ncbi:MAG TPA: hypothetical protein VIH76_00170 [Candidatus Acidoferrales bacterium]
MFRGNSDPRSWLAVGFVGGIVAFFRGFKVYREYRLIEDTPHIRIAAAPIGLVRVRGVAQSTDTILSPVSRTPCCFYRVVIEKWRESGRNAAGFEQLRTDADGPLFHIADDSGKILVDLHGADFDLVQTAMRILDGTSDSPSATMAQLDAVVAGNQPGAYVPPSEHELRDYVSDTGIKSVTRWIGNKLETQSPLADSAKEQTRQAFLTLLREMTPPETNTPTIPLDSMRKFLEARAAGGDPHAVQMLAAFKEHAVAIEAEAVRMNTTQESRGKYKLTEYCVLPNTAYEIVGTCRENLDAAAACDRCLIGRGREESTFRISWKTAAEVEVGLRNRAMYMIFGGATVSVVCLYFFLSISNLL